MRVHRGFTLVELIVAVVVGAIVAGSTTAAVTGFMRAKSRAAARYDAFRRAETAASLIAADLMVAARERDLVAATVYVTEGANGPYAADQLLVYARSLEPVRGLPDQPEGGDREIQYKLFPPTDGSAGFVLWRRVQAVPDDFGDAGGVATPMVAGIQSLNLRAMDAQEGYESWDSDSQGYPHAVSVQVTAMSADGQVTATVRRVVALDRTPLPTAAPETTQTETPAGGTSTPAAGSGNTVSGAPGGGSGGGGIAVPPGGGRPPGGGGNMGGGGGNRGGGAGGGNRGSGGGGGGRGGGSGGGGGGAGGGGGRG
jgi:prepilin-type N-terminal cleavage/methylation domain-containing protein